jgi:hypothetical protein
MIGPGDSIARPDLRMLNECGLSSIAESEEIVLWIGRPSVSGIVFAGINKLLIMILMTSELFLLLALLDSYRKTLSIKMEQFLALTIPLTMILIYVLVLVLVTRKLIYIVGGKNIVLARLLRDQKNNESLSVIAKFNLRKIPYLEFQVARFDIGNLDLSNSADRNGAVWGTDIRHLAHTKIEYDAIPDGEPEIVVRRQLFIGRPQQAGVLNYWIAIPKVSVLLDVLTSEVASYRPRKNASPDSA